MQSIDFLKNVVMLNKAESDMAAMVGFSASSSMIPVEHIARAIQRAPTLTNIQVSNSQVGVLNTGSIQKIDAAITLSKGSEVEAIATQIEQIVQTLLNSSELSDPDKNEALELTETIAEEVVGKRRLSAITAMVKDLREKVSGVLALSGATDKLLQLIKDLI
ncbi:hypothetical protein [Aliiroseovarius crassostreae]|uniref:hypothetical protein n=1 Tax=Aliiroseovarius crassostreae TaxID=154981 RepID=UPI003C7AB15D